MIESKEDSNYSGFKSKSNISSNKGSYYDDDEDEYNSELESES